MERFNAEVAQPAEEKASRLHKLVTERDAMKQAIDQVRLDSVAALALLEAAGTGVST